MNQSSKIHQWLFGKTKPENGNTEMPLQTQDTPAPLWYQSIQTLPLFKFVECQVDNNIAALTISGFPSQVQLLTAWAEIQQEYGDSIGTMEHKMYLGKLKEIVLLKIKYQVIHDMVEMLQKVYYKPFADRLNKLLFVKFEFDYTDPEKYNQQLQNCLNRSKSIKINIDLKELDFAEMKAKHEGGPSKAPTRQYYLEYMIALSNFAKYAITDQITVSEFCIRIKQYNDHCEQMENMSKKK